MFDNIIRRLIRRPWVHGLKAPSTVISMKIQIAEMPMYGIIPFPFFVISYQRPVANWAVACDQFFDTNLQGV